MSEQQSGRLMRGGGGGDQLNGAMKLFSSLGLTPSDLNVLAEIPEDEITVETLPSILMRLKSRKGASGERGGTSSEASYQGGRDRWDSSLGPGPARAQTSADFGFSSMQNVSGRGFGSGYGGAGDGRAERPYSELSRQTSYGGLSSGPLLSDPVFMQRRMGSPSSGKVQDFLGDAPSMFPHVCSLCNIDVHSSMEWNQHIKELRHAENSRRFLDTYPEWKPGMASGRSGGHRDTPNMSPGLLGASPMSLGHTGGMPSSWGGDRSLAANKLVQNLGRSKVVVVKYDRKPLSNQTLFSLAEMFGTLREHLVLDKKAFLEMDTHEEALDMVNYYKQNPTSLYGKPITFYLSQTLMVIKKIPGNQPMERPAPPPPAWDVKSPGICSKVVFFSRLPREEHKKRELLTVAERFGTVQKYLFLKDEAFVQLGTEEDAEMLVKYYSSNPLIIEGRRVSLNLCAKYKTLNVSHKVAQFRRSGRPESTSTKTTSSKSPSRGKEEEKEGKKNKKVVKTEETKKKEVKKEDKKEKSAVKEDEEEEEDSVVLQGGEDEGDDEEHLEEEEGEKEEDTAKDEEQDKDEEEDQNEEQDKDEEEDEVEEKGKDEEEDKDQEEPEKAESVKDEEEEHKEVPESDEVTAEGVATKGEVTEGQTEATETETPTDELKNKDEENAGESCDEEKKPEEKMDQDFMENMEDFVTLDELEDDEGDAHKDAAAAKQTKKGGMRVVSIMGFHRDYNFLEEMLALAKPFGTVERHLVLDRRPEAYIQFAKEEEAIAMHKFYNRNVIATVCGRQVKIVRSIRYPTIQTASSRVVYIGQLPNTKYSDDDVLKLAEPFGNIRKYSLHRWRRECFIEMETVQEAEKMANACKEKPLSLMGRHLLVYVSRKYAALHNGVLYSKRTKRTKSSSPQKSTEPSEEPQAKKRKEEETKDEGPEQNSAKKLSEVSDEKNISKDAAAEVKGQQEEDQEEAAMDTLSNQNEETETPPPADKPSAASLPLPPYDPDVPIGTEHMKMGYYCRICFLFYSNKDTAMKRHCSSRAHYDKLQKHLEKEQKPSTTTEA